MYKFGFLCGYYFWWAVDPERQMPLWHWRRIAQEVWFDRMSVPFFWVLNKHPEMHIGIQEGIDAQLNTYP